MRAILVYLMAVFVVIPISPSAAASGRLGAQVAGITNKLTGELPQEGKWRGRRALGYGLTAELSLTPDIAISFQPSYTPRHARQEFEIRGNVVDHYDYELNYLTLPLLIRVSGTPPGARGFVTAGLDLSILLDATIHVDGSPDDITDTFKQTTIGALFGAGIMVPIRRNLLTVEVRYNQGLADIIERDGSVPEPGLGSPSVKYRGLSLIVGFLFTLGGE